MTRPGEIPSSDPVSAPPVPASPSAPRPASSAQGEPCVLAAGASSAPDGTSAAGMPWCRMPWCRMPWWMGAVILVATVLLYLPSLGGEPVYDDLEMILRNPLITDLANAPKAFGMSYWEFIESDVGATTGYWRPLTALTLMVAHALGDGEFWAFHLLSVLLHACASLVAARLVTRWVGDFRVGFVAGLLFGLHPIHVEAVAWMTSINDPLVGLFALLCLDAYLAWRGRGSRGVPLLAPAWLALALLSKEQAVAVFPLLLVVDLGRRRSPDEPSGWLGGFGQLGRAWAPMLAIALAYYGARVAVFGSVLAGVDTTVTGFGVDGMRMALLRVELLGGAFELLALPLELNVFRPFRPALPEGDPVFLRAVLALAAATGLAVWAVLRKRKHTLSLLLIVPAACVPILLRPESLGRFPLSDRFLYLPALGWTAFLALAAWRMLPRWAAVALLALVALGYGGRSWTRQEAWSDEDAFFAAALEANPDSPYVLWSAARVHIERYQRSGDPADLARALDIVVRAQDAIDAAKVDPDQEVFFSSTDVLQVNLAYAWCLAFEARIDDFHDYQTPIALLERLLVDVYEVRQGAEEARAKGLEVWGEPLEVERVHDALGVVNSWSGNLPEAERHFRLALAANPAFAESQHNYGVLLMLLGQPGRAREHFEAALAQRPGNFQDRMQLATALFEEGSYQRAEELARALQAENPEHPDPMFLLASIRAQRGDPASALTWTDRLLEVAPNHGQGWHTRAKVLMQMEETQEAILALRRATEEMPRDFGAHYNLGVLLLNSGATEAALPYLVRAYAVNREPGLDVSLRQQLLQIRITDPRFAVELAEVERLRRRTDYALAWIQVALELNPGDGENHLRLGRIHRDAGDLGPAVAAMRRSTELLPERFTPHFELGLLLRDLGRPDEALVPLRRALELGPPAGWDAETRSGTVEELRGLIEELGSTPGPVGPPTTG